MRNLRDFICEQYNYLKLSEVAVKFTVGNDGKYIIEVPDSYMEDKMQTYLDDLAKQTFIGNKIKDFFGVNADKLYDAYFEYNGYEETQLKADLPFDNEFSENDSEEELKHIKLKDVYFILKFDNFTILDNPQNLADDSQIIDTLSDIFNRCISDEYDWKIKFSLDSNNIEFKK